MSKMAELSYDIEQLYIDGFSPSRIAKILECPIGLVYDWLEENNMADEDYEPKSFRDWPGSAKQRLIDDVVEMPQEEFSPFNTQNS
jgi:transposase